MALNYTQEARFQTASSPHSNHTTQELGPHQNPVAYRLEILDQGRIS